ncbi:MAG: carbohydrate porin [Bacteroidota bacterium]
MKEKKIIKTLLLSTFLIIVYGYCHAQEIEIVVSHNPVNSTKTLKNAREGEEKDNKEKSANAFEFRTVYQGSILGNVRGGIKTGVNYMGKLSITMRLDTEQAGMWKGGSFFLNGINVHGGTPTSNLVGDFQPISRNEATERTGLFELWYQHRIGRLSILAGLHDMNTSFGTSKFGGGSTNSAFGMFPSIAPNLGNTFSIFPRTMPGLYLKYASEKITLQGAIYTGEQNTVEEDPFNVQWNFEESLFLVGEVHLKRMREKTEMGIIKLGAIYHSGNFPALASSTLQRKRNLGVYLITDQMLLCETADKGQGLGFFLEAGIAPGNQNMIDFFSAGGVVYKGLFPKRDNDVLFFGTVNSLLDENFIDSLPFPRDRSRTILEMNYLLKINENISVQPDIQYIIDPSVNSSLRNALLGILNFTFSH